MTNEIMKAEKFELGATQDEFKEMIEGIAEDMEGLGAIQLTRVNVPNGGATAWDVDDEDEDALVGVIVAKFNRNYYYDRPFDPNDEDNRPACMSRDGKTGVTIDGEIRECASCPFNQWTDEGKKCTNKVDLYLLRSGEMLPLQVTLPPTSLKSLKDYVKKLLNKGSRLATVVTSITLERVKGNFTYSQAKFEMVEKLDAEGKAAMKAYAAEFKAFLEQQEAAYAAARAAEAEDDVIDVSYEELMDIPFTR